MTYIRVASLLCVLIQFVVAQQIRYPEVRRNESVVDDYYGTLVSDLYRHLEDLDSEEVQHFINAQNNLTLEYIGRSSVKDEIEKKLTQVFNYPKFSVPLRFEYRYFSSMNTGLQNQDVWYVQESLDSAPHVFFDPNELSPNGTIALSQIQFSEDGEVAALVLNSRGADMATIHFLHIDSGEYYPETIEDVRFPSVTWSKDNLGIFYYRHPQGGSDVGHRIYYHLLGSDQREDALLVEMEDLQISQVSFRLSDDGAYLIVLPATGAGGEETQVWYASLEEEFQSGGIKDKLQLIPIIDNWENAYRFIALENGMMYLTTNNGAPNYRVIGISLNNTNSNDWITVVPEHEINILNWAVNIDIDKLLLLYMVDVRSQLEIRSIENGSLIQRIDTPVGSSLLGYSGRKFDTEFFFMVVSILSPGIIYRVDLTTSPYTVELLKESKVPGFNLEDFVVEQLFYESKDGTKVPMYITHKKNLTLDGSNNALLFGYGGFGINLLPQLLPDRLVFLRDFDGVYATPNIRGGGEYGRQWHEGGRLLNKQNVFDDFQAAAEYLIRGNYTSASKLALHGASNGGLLVGACANQRPDLFAAVINQVGVNDLLRFQKFPSGSAWCSEYGCSDSGNQTIFENLYRLSPLHNVRLPANTQVQYPATLISTGDHDDRVVPIHSYKLGAELQYKIGRLPGQTNPILIRIYADTGHGQGKPISMLIAEYAEFYAFLVEAAGFAFMP